MVVTIVINSKHFADGCGAQMLNVFVFDHVPVIIPGFQKLIIQDREIRQKCQHKNKQQPQQVFLFDQGCK
jgi:hypothetical protein